MSVTRHHAHAEQHRGFVPEDQLADGTPTVGYAVLATGTGTAEWGPVTGGDPGTPCDCCHTHTTERFTAAGGSLETFSLAFAPLYGVRAYSQGLRVDPDEVTVTGLDIGIDTTAGDNVVIDYERECAVGEGFLMFPGVNESHEFDGTPFDMNILGNFSTTGPAYLVIHTVVTVGSPTLMVGTDAFPGTGYDVENVYDSTSGPTFPLTGDVYLFRLEYAADYWIAGTMGYDATLDGSGTYEVFYPVGGGTPLTFPGTDTTFFGSYHVNVIATINAVTPTILFVTLDTDLPAGYGLYVISDDEAVSFGYDNTGADSPALDPVPAGTYVFVLDGEETHPGDWHVMIDNGAGYHGGLTGSGEYETHVP